jgi:hypothetical protein
MRDADPPRFATLIVVEAVVLLVIFCISPSARIPFHHECHVPPFSTTQEKLRLAKVVE